MKRKSSPSIITGKHSGSSGKEEVLNQSLDKMRKQHMKILTVEPQQEFEALRFLTTAEKPSE